MPIDPAKLLAQSEVRLFGWLVGQPPAEADVAALKNPEKKEEANNKINATAIFLAHETQDKTVKGELFQATANYLWLANIHAFSCEGRYTQFRVPALFLVPNSGDLVAEKGEESNPAKLGLAQIDMNMKFAADLRYWVFDRTAQIVRLDMSTDTVQRLVVDLETTGAQGRRVDLVGQESSWMGRLGISNR